MLFDTDIISIVYKNLLNYHKDIPIILDPVMISTSGNKLLKDDSISLLCETLIPISTLITPNIDETIHLLSKTNSNLISLKSILDVKNAAKILSKNFKIKNVLIKGGHLNINDDGYVYDILYEEEIDEFSIFKNKLINNNNTHGSGCSLSSSIASNIAIGFNLKESIEKSINYIHKSIFNGFKVGKSDYGTLNHFLK